MPDAVIALSDAIDELYWKSHRPPEDGALAGRLRAGARHARAEPGIRAGRAAFPTRCSPGAPKGYTDAVLDDEFPLSMFYEALAKKMADVIESTKGITG